MLQSMTGFGRGSTEFGGRSFTVELRSVNHRYCDVRLHVPNEFARVGPKLEAGLRKKFTRGRIDLRLDVALTSGAAVTLDVNHARVEALGEALKQIASALGVPEQPSATWVASQPGVLRSMEEEVDDDTLFAALRPALDVAMQELLGMRTREGAALEAELRKHLTRLSASSALVAERVEPSIEVRRDRLRERVNALLEDSALDPARLEHEVAILSERSDVTEELERLTSHFKHAEHFFEAGGAVGRKLDFLIQEMNRETNTIGSKSGDSGIAHLVVEMKAELERMREQVQNVE